ncbi:MAG: cation:proton antiporter [Woeseiaceae bacterium]|nr:cation:proton antiporter [Woeseiaceae bacterium]
MYAHLAILAVFVFLYSIIAGRVERSIFSGPMIFVTAGVVVGPVLGWFPGDATGSELRVLADLTLALFLFVDSANANLSELRRSFGIPSRMLLIGLPGSIALGFGLALVMFDALTIYEAAVLGAMLAATDAALGKPVITNTSVPDHLREGLNVESGLNDGLCVPIVLALIALELGTEQGLGSGLAVTLIAEELGIGALVGLGVTAIGTGLFRFCQRQGWVTGVWLQITFVALAIACFGLAQSLHGSGYIAAFTGGALFGYLTKGEAHALVSSAEGIGEMLALLTWSLFGIAVVDQVYDQLNWQVLVYAVLSLTVVRMVPIFVSLAGSGEKSSSRLFLGWFGPRGLASIVFAVIVLDEGLPESKLIALIVASTVILSLVLHGMTANPLAGWIAREES